MTDPSFSRNPLPARRAARRARSLRVAIAAVATIAAALPLSAASAQPKALEVPDRNIISAPRGERLLMLLNLQADRDKLRAMTPEDATATLVETGKRYASDLLNAEHYRGKYANADVIFAFVENMDEYNRPNYRGMVRIGTVSYRREESRIQTVSTQIETAVIR